MSEEFHDAYEQPSQCTEEPRYEGDKNAKVLLKVVESLYRDRIRPLTTDVERRLQEMNASRYLQCQYKQIAKSAKKIFICHTYESNDVIYLRKTPEFFLGWVDPKAPENPFPMTTWKLLNDYLVEVLRKDGNEISEKDGQVLKPWQFRGGRYGMAVSLVEANAPCTFGLSLGEVCHLVQLAISSGLLAYENNVLQPICASYSIASAFLETSSTLNKLDRSGDPPIGDLKNLKKLVKQLLQNKKDGILLSQLKKVFSRQFGWSVVPSVFGYTKLSSLLCSAEFADTCTVYCQPKTNRVKVYPAGAKCSGADLIKMMPVSRQETFNLSGIPRHLLVAPQTHHDICYAFWSFAAKSNYQRAQAHQPVFEENGSVEKEHNVKQERPLVPSDRRDSTVTEPDLSRGATRHGEGGEGRDRTRRETLLPSYLASLNPQGSFEEQSFTDDASNIPKPATQHQHKPYCSVEDYQTMVSGSFVDSVCSVCTPDAAHQHDIEIALADDTSPRDWSRIFFWPMFPMPSSNQGTCGHK